jgi:hypothetical protein
MMARSSCALAEPVALTVAAVDHAHMAGVRHDDVVPQLLEQPTDPGRVRAHLEGDTGRFPRAEPATQRSFCRLDTPLFDDLPVFVQHAQPAEPIAEIQTDDYVILSELRHGANLRCNGSGERPGGTAEPLIRLLRNSGVGPSHLNSLRPNRPVSSKTSGGGVIRRRKCGVRKGSGRAGSEP